VEVSSKAHSLSSSVQTLNGVNKLSKANWSRFDETVSAESYG
jgi:hypothetical protein